jgi:hypothetical protein
VRELEHSVLAFIAIPDEREREAPVRVILPAQHAHSQNIGVKLDRALQVADSQHRVQNSHGNFLRLNFDHFEVFLAGAALRTDPIHRDILPTSAGGNALFRAPDRFVVNKAADETHPSAKRLLGGERFGRASFHGHFRFYDKMGF